MFPSSIVCTPIDSSYKTNQKFLHEVLSVKKILQNKNLPLYHRSFVDPIYNYVIWKCFWRNTFPLKKNSFSKLLFLFLISILCAPLTNHTKTNNFFWGEKTSRKNSFLQIIVFLFYHRTSVPSLIILGFKKVVHEKSFSEKLVFPKKIVF